jgi:hypothetical protein
VHEVEATPESRAADSAPVQSHDYRYRELSGPNGYENLERDGHYDTLTNALNEYLRSLNMDGLSQEEVEEVNQGVGDRSGFLLEGPAEELYQATSQLKRPADNHKIPPKQSKKNYTKPHSRPRMSSFDPLAGPSLAESSTQFVSFAAKASIELSDIYHTEDSSPEELLILSRSIIYYSQLLHSIAKIARYGIGEGNMRDLSVEVIEDNNDVMAEITDLLKHAQIKIGRRSMHHALRMALRWSSSRQQAHLLMAQVESPKTTLSFILLLKDRYEQYIFTTCFLASEGRHPLILHKMKANIRTLLRGYRC